MCDSEGQPASVADALGMLDRALGYLATADTAALPAPVQAGHPRVSEGGGRAHRRPFPGAGGVRRAGRVRE